MEGGSAPTAQENPWFNEEEGDVSGGKTAKIGISSTSDCSLKTQISQVRPHTFPLVYPSW